MKLRVYTTVVTTSLQLNNYILYFIRVETLLANYNKINLLLFSSLTTMIPHKVSLKYLRFCTRLVNLDGKLGLS